MKDWCFAHPYGKTYAKKLFNQKNRANKKHPLDCGHIRCGGLNGYNY